MQLAADNLKMHSKAEQACRDVVLLLRPAQGMCFWQSCMTCCDRASKCLQHRNQQTGRPSCDFSAPYLAALPAQAADLRVSIKGSATVKHDTQERKEGGVEVTYAAPMSGEYRVAVSIGPTPVPGSPFRVSCQQPRPCEKLSRADWGQGVAFVGERYVASVTIADQFGDLWAADAK